MNGNDITALGFTGKAIGLALNAARHRETAGQTNDEIRAELGRVLHRPEAFIRDPLYADLGRELLGQAARFPDTLRERPLSYTEWGSELIDENTRAQMDTAMRLPISVAGALMPDAHVGFGLPIGGVLATDHAVIPYAVGVDIGCAMALSVLPVANLSREDEVRLLRRNTRFGAGHAWERKLRPDHAVLDEDTWHELPLLRQLRNKAAEQLGTSGSGNHFVEFGTLTLEAADLGLAPGQYIALLSHSGSRGFGAQVAGHYTQVAQNLHPDLDPDARKLAWLDMDRDEGQAYWTAMNLAGRYALANHEVIHARIARALGVKPLVTVRNSHNLAWKQRMPDGREVIVHRKGATPAGQGQLGIIPGSMADPGYVVRGKGNTQALESASHGSGRLLGRKQAERELSRSAVKEYLEARDVTVMGGGVDEAPQAYKNIDRVMASQADLVDVVARFMPRVVRMDTGRQDI
ncbi:RtcB family protein [Deinococcus deserti]|uniref:3'-phosphate/5'-hydroxy nucleic acid ligase n=1 Tax=Deinococcus deserti (strain DSM 17065 / CIP 109153 / LMG 22923 / VCD115) TaxID=546414 RepID=C1D3R0_DEIDV|nr:RtcB family protein [Deinococcus deserti]ACO48139.1 putative RtcB family protein [Deinococcus deserti VCD115]